MKLLNGDAAELGCFAALQKSSSCIALVPMNRHQGENEVGLAELRPF